MDDDLVQRIEELETRLARLNLDAESEKRDNTYLTALHETALGLIRRLNLDELLQDIIERAARLGNTPHGYIYLYESQSGALVLRYGIGEYRKSIGYRVKPGQGITGQVWQTGKTMVVADYLHWTDRIRDPRFAALRSVVGFPLKFESRVAGVIGLGYFDRPANLDRDLIRMLSRFAELASIALDNARLYTRLKEELSERKRAEAALRESEARYRESEERFRRVFQTIPDPVTIIRAGDGACIDVNEEFLELTGWQRNAVIGKTAGDLDLWVEPADRETLMQGIEKDGRVRNLEARFRLKDGRTLIGLISAMPLTLGQERQIVTITRDITDRKRLEKQLIQAQKMEAIGTLAGGIAHDFNNLMMGIQGRTSLMLGEVDPAHPHHEHLKGIEAHLHKATDLTRRLLGFARGGKYEVRPLDLNAVIREQNRMFGRTRKEITVEESLEPSLWTVQADQSQIEQVLLNLYINAWQAMPSGGTLQVRTGNTVLDEREVQPHGVEAGEYVAVSVADTGIGMDTATQQRIFEPFFTTKDIGHGTGLGLASVYGIIEHHAGFIRVASEPGRGTCFTIHLPALRRTPAAKRNAAADLIQGHGTILLVDDEPMVLEIGKLMLLRLGFQVLTASGGEEGLQTYKANLAQIDLVILDMIMPDLSGRETFERLKSIDPRVRVLLSSGYSIDGEATEILERGCNGFIQKPFDLQALSKKIRQVLGNVPEPDGGSR